MTTAMQAIKYTNEGIHFLVDYEEERKTNEQITSNNCQYEFLNPSELKAENKRKRKRNSQIGPQKYYKNNFSSYKYHDDIKKKHYYRIGSCSDSEPKQLSQECESINEDHIQNTNYNPENTDIDNNVYEHHEITTVQPQKNKTPITLINEWAMRGDRSYEKKPLVSYTLVAITGHAHRPIFTYMCRVNDKTAKGDGQSKKEAKQNAAAQMWEKLFKISSTTNNDKVITSTTITDNFDVNENDATNLTSTEGSQIIYETDSNIEDEELLQHSNYDMVKIAHCNMNPVGALQELSTAYKWTPPFYSFEKLGPLNKDQQQNGAYKTVSYKVTCKVFHLQTTETASTKKEAKRLAARQMFDQIRNIGEEKLNTLKSLEFKNDCEIKQEKNQKLPLKWNSSLSFQSYFTAAISKGMNSIKDSSESYFQFEGKKNKEEMNTKKEYQQELEQAIVQFNHPNLSAIDLLQTLSQQLNFLVTYMCVNDMNSQQQIKNNNGPDEEFTILIQVTTVPVIATIGQAKSLYDAAEVAASSILHTIQNLLIYTSSSLIQNQNNDEQVEQSTMANY